MVNDINDYKLADVFANNLPMFLSKLCLFNDSIANNIAYGKPDASREEIIAAAKNAHVLEFAEQYA